MRSALITSLGEFLIMAPTVLRKMQLRLKIDKIVGLVNSTNVQLLFTKIFVRAGKK